MLHCSAGIDSVPAISMTLDPNQVSNVSFVIYSYHATGKVNHCKCELPVFDKIPWASQFLTICAVQLLINIKHLSLCSGVGWYKW